jgi:hypothetical protein
MSLFKNTINPADESNQHVLYTIETLHPYAPNTRMQDCIATPGASNISITFDKVGQTAHVCVPSRVKRTAAVEH